MIKTHYANEQIVRFSWDCADCECCPKKFRAWCREHGMHFDSCPCIKANDGNYIYFERQGILYARPFPIKHYLKRVDAESEAEEKTDEVEESQTIDAEGP